MTDDFDVFLENWAPGPGLLQAVLPQYLANSMMRDRALEDYEGTGPAIRAQNIKGTKAMDGPETLSISYQYFVDRQPQWSADFRERLIDGLVPVEKVDSFIKSFAIDWVDGRKRRQSSANMMAIKKSLRDFDDGRKCRSQQFVVEKIPKEIDRLLSPDEMEVVLNVNAEMLEYCLPDYLDHLNDDRISGLSSLYVRRGVFMPPGQFEVLRELNHLSSYSLSLGPVEMFAQTRGRGTDEAGTPTILSTEIGTIQHRIVAFAPFIEGMTLGQLEFVVAPPITEIKLIDHGIHGGIREFTF